MRQFQISAIVDERILWELMTLLERSKARAILARPYANGAEDEAAPVRATRMRANGKEPMDLIAKRGPRRLRPYRFNEWQPRARRLLPWPRR
jgi:hypothetical protein